MRMRRKLLALALAAGTAVAAGGVAGPVLAAAPDATGDGKGSQTVVLDGLQPGTTMGEIRASAEKAVGRTLSPIARTMVVEAEKNELTSAQIEALRAGKEPAGARLLGMVEDPKPTAALADVANVSDPIVVDGGVIVIYLKCMIIIDGLGGPHPTISENICILIPVFVPRP